MVPQAVVADHLNIFELGLDNDVVACVLIAVQHLARGAQYDISLYLNVCAHGWAVGEIKQILRANPARVAQEFRFDSLPRGKCIREGARL